MTPVVLLTADEIAKRVDRLAKEIAPRIDERTVAVALLTGGLWFAADLTRALAGLGLHLPFDALWLSSYGEGQSSRGHCDVRAGLQRPVAGRKVLLIDDVLDSGLTLSEGARILQGAGPAKPCWRYSPASPGQRPAPCSPTSWPGTPRRDSSWATGWTPPATGAVYPISALWTDVRNALGPSGVLPSAWPFHARAGSPP